ncbi:MAG: NAD(P)H-dependent oxidoreductase subunit E [Thermoplasmatota archaeon]
MVIGAKDRKVLDGLLAEVEGLDSPVLFLLHRIQEEWGCISWETARYISEALGVPLTQIYSAVTFYEQFSLKAQGKHVIRLCRGVVCHGKGSRDLMTGIRDHLGIREGETTADGLFTLAESSCIGQCDGSPSMMIDHEVHRKIDLGRAIQLIEDLRSGGE